MKYSFLLLLLAVSFTSPAQVTPRNILATRYPATAVKASLMPRSQWAPYPRNADAWRQALPDSVRVSLIRAGEQAAGQPVEPLSATLTLDYVRNGNRSRYERVSFARRDNLMDLAIAESIDDKGRFTDAILNVVWAICEESFWGVPAHLGTQKAKNGLPDVTDRTVDLFGAETAAVLALVDYLVGDKLAQVSPLVRPRIYAETNQRLFVPLIEQPNRYGYLKAGAKVNNWNPWIMSNWLTATLLLEPDESRRSQMVSAAMNGLDLYINGLGGDGGCDEGPSYWFVAGASVFDALELIHSATGGKVDVYQEPIIRNMASYIYKMHIADGYFVDFADADPMLKPDGLMLYRFGKTIQDDTLAQFGRWAFRQFGANAALNCVQRQRGFNRQRRLQNLLTISDAGSQPATFGGVRDAWFTDVQVMTARSDKGLYVATHGGHNAESHNHNDVGDFILYADGQPVIIDVGRGAYTAKTFSSKRYDIWYNQSQYHNLPIVNGLGQQAGQTFGARNVRYNRSSSESSLTMDVAPAYAANAGIRSWNRVVLLNRTKNTVDVRDAYALDRTPTSVQQAFMTVCPVDTTRSGQVVFRPANGRPVVLTYDPKAWQVAVETMPLTSPEDVTLSDKWTGRPIQRVLLTHTNPKASGQSVFQFGF